MTPGHSTSEFRLAAFAVLALAVLLVFAIWHDSIALAAVAVAGKVWVVGCYAISRGIAKSLNIVNWIRRHVAPTSFKHSLFSGASPREGAPMDAISTVATKVTGFLPASLNLSSAEQAVVSGAVSGVLKAGLIVVEKLIAKYLPSVAPIATLLITEFVTPPATPSAPAAQ